MAKNLSDDPERLLFLNNRNAEYLEGPRGKEYAKLRHKLLSIAGTEVCLQPEPDLARLLKRGRLFPARNIKRLDGDLHRCHGNSALLWLRDKEDGLRIVTGWGLVADGLWHQHSFCWSSSAKRIVDSNCWHEAYFGCLLDNGESIGFFFANVPDWENILKES